MRTTMSHSTVFTYLHIYIDTQTKWSRVTKHVLKRFQSDSISNTPKYIESRKPNSLTTKHINTMGHRIDLNTTSRTFYKNCQGRNLRLIEPLAIRTSKCPSWILENILQPRDSIVIHYANYELGWCDNFLSFPW